MNHWRETASRGQFSGHTSWAQTALPNAMSSHVQSSLLLLLHPAVATVGQASLDSPLQSGEAADSPVAVPRTSSEPCRPAWGCLSHHSTHTAPSHAWAWPFLGGHGGPRRARANLLESPLPSSLPPSPAPGLLGPHRRISEMPDHSQAPEVTAAIASPSGGRGGCAAACLGGGLSVTAQTMEDRAATQPPVLLHVQSQGSLQTNCHKETGLGPAGVRH